MTFRRKKSSRQRGSHTHGWGAMKKHRGAGHRGGRGNAGSGKRGDAKKPSYWADKAYYGKHGFTPKNQQEARAISLRSLEARLPDWLKDGRASEQAGKVAVDLTKLGFTKLLGSGHPSRPLRVTVAAATGRAQEKVRAAGGAVEGLAAPPEISAPEENA